MAVPAANPAEMGAKLEARLSGVEMSATVMVAAHDKPATPNPVMSRQTYNSSKPEDNPMHPTPVEMAINV